MIYIYIGYLFVYASIRMPFWWLISGLAGVTVPLLYGLDTPPCCCSHCMLVVGSICCLGVVLLTYCTYRYDMTINDTMINYIIQWQSMMWIDYINIYIYINIFNIFYTMIINDIQILHDMYINIAEKPHTFPFSQALTHGALHFPPPRRGGAVPPWLPHMEETHIQSLWDMDVNWYVIVYKL